MITLDGKEFRTLPTSYDWEYKIKMNDWKTMGGKVIQIYGVRMGDLTISGQFSTPEEQAEWFKKVKSIADAQVPVLGAAAPRPVRLIWTERGWDFMVFVKSFKQVGAATSVMARNDIADIKWTMTVFVNQDNGKIVKAAQDAAAAAYIRRISDGLGWQQSEWNGMVEDPAFADALEQRTVLTYLFDERQRAVENEYIAPAPDQNETP